MLWGLFGHGSYKTAENSTKRPARVQRKAMEEWILRQHKRDRLGATLLDLLRNDPVLNWALDKFLDYFTFARFAMRSGDFGLDDEVEQWFARWMEPGQCDAAGRSDFDTLMRNFGRMIAIDGDAAFLKLRGGRLQAIETDRLRGDFLPEGVRFPEGTQVYNGVAVDHETGRALGYLLHDRGERGAGYNFREVLNPADLIFRGNFFRPDQVRGVSLLAPAGRKFEDVESIDEAQLIKAKLHALFGVAVLSERGSGMDQAADFGYASESSGETTEVQTQGVYSVTPEMENPLKLELQPGDKVETIESHTPSNEYQAFADNCLRKALLNLSIPYTFYDSRQSSYSAMKQDRAEFKFAMQRFVRINLSVRREVTEWLMPRCAYELGLKPADAARIAYRWIPQAEPWLDENAEADAAVKRTGAGLDDLENVAETHGRDVYDILRATKRVQDYARRAGIVLGIGTPGTAMMNADKLNNTTTTPTKEETK